MISLILELLLVQAQPQQQPKCIPVYSLPSDVEIQRIMLDKENDWWALIRYRSTGKQMIGYIKQQTDQFCPTGEGLVNRES